MERMYRNLNDRVIRRRRQRFEPCCAELLVGGKRKIKRKYVQDVIIDDERDNERLALKIQPRRSTLDEIFFRYLIPRRMLRHRSKDFRQRAIPSHTDNVDMSANANSILDATRALLAPTTLRLILLESFPRNAVRPAPSLEFPARSWYAVKTGVHTRAHTRTGSVRRRHSDQRFPREKEGWLHSGFPVLRPHKSSSFRPPVLLPSQTFYQNESRKYRRRRKYPGRIPPYRAVALREREMESRSTSFSRICDRVMDIVPSLQRRLLRSRVGRN